MTDTKEETQTTAVVEPTVHPAIELLLARMKSNPDEFYPKGHRWHKLIGEYSGHFTEAEHVAINEGLREIAIGAFHVAVMNELLCEPEEEKELLQGLRGVGIGTNTYINSPYTSTTIGTLSAQTQQDQYQKLLRQINSAQNVYPRTQTTVPAGPAKPKGWLGGLF